MFVLLGIETNSSYVKKVTLYDVSCQKAVRINCYSKDSYVGLDIKNTNIHTIHEDGYTREVRYSPDGVQVRFGRYRHTPQPEHYRRMVYTRELDGPGALMVGSSTVYYWKEWKKIEEVKFDTNIYDVIDLFQCCSKEKLKKIVPVRLQYYYVD